MQVAQHRKTCLSIIVSILFSSTDIWATHQHSVPVKNNNRFIKIHHVLTLSSLVHVNKQSCLTGHPPKKEGKPEAPSIDLPLVKVAHKSSMELLHLFFIPTTIPIPIYTPFLQHLGIKFNLIEYIYGLYNPKHQTYTGGIDLHLRNQIQLSIELGYGHYIPTAQANQSRYAAYSSKGRHGLVALLYVTRPKPLTNAHIGIAYGSSAFHCKDKQSAEWKPGTAHWVKIILSSELRLVSNSGLYGGIQFDIARLLKSTPFGDNKRDNSPTPYYNIPGYGTLLNKNLIIQIIPYIKWNISFLKKKITF